MSARPQGASPRQRLGQGLQRFWSGLAARERRGLVLALTVLGLALGWSLLLAPALSVLHQAPAQHEALARELQALQTLQAQAQAWRQQVPPDGAETRRRLQDSVSQGLGTSARLELREGQAILSLDKASAAALAQWLVQARVDAHVLPQEAHLVRQPAPADQAARWNGTLIFTLPAR